MSRFGQEFLAAQVARRKDWSQKGIVSGSGRPFTDAAGGPAPSKGKGKKRSQAPARGEPGYISPHGAALAALAAKPSLEVGHVEHYDQVRVFHCIELTDPELYDLMAAIPNGGPRAAKTGADLKAEGTKPGYPDMVIDLPAGIYHGARIELKALNGTLSDSQILTLNRLHRQGYYCAACFGWEDAVSVIKQYRALTPGERMPEHHSDHKWLTPQPMENRSNDEQNHKTAVRGALCPAAP